MSGFFSGLFGYFNEPQQNKEETDDISITEEGQEETDDIIIKDNIEPDNIDFDSYLPVFLYSHAEFSTIQENKKIEVPVCCDENFALDIVRLENKLNLKREKIYENFFSKEFFCYMTGFIAGMPFLGDLSKNMRASRLETPRVRVPKGSVALTEQFANIYTFESPGGWNVIGNSPLRIFDSSKEESPNLINPGDIVLFKEISKNQYENFNE